MIFTSQNRSSPKDDTPVNCLKLKLFHILYSNKLSTEVKVEKTVELVETEMTENGVSVTWEHAEDSKSEEESEVFHYQEQHIERVFKILLSCTIIPFLGLLEPLLFQEKSFKNLKRQAASDEMFGDFTSWYLYTHIFGGHVEKFTWEQFFNFIYINKESVFNPEEIRAEFFSFAL